MDVDKVVEEIEKIMMYRGKMPEEGRLRLILYDFGQAVWDDARDGLENMGENHK